MRAMELLNVDMGFLQETKLTKGRHTRRYGEYSVIATDAPSVRQGGLAFFWRESKLYEVEEVHKHGRNVIAAQVFNGASRFYVIGAYILPTSLTALAEV